MKYLLYNISSLPQYWSLLNLKTLPDVLFRVSLVEIAALVILLAYFLEVKLLYVALN